METLKMRESVFRVKVSEIDKGLKLTSVCYVKSHSADKDSIQSALDLHPLNTGKNWKFVKIVE